jgi:hypothetical protein
MSDWVEVTTDVGPISVYVSPGRCINLMQTDDNTDEENAIHMCALEEWDAIDKAVRKALSE